MAISVTLVPFFSQKILCTGFFLGSPSGEIFPLKFLKKKKKKAHW
jgi:hypothetical protein